MNKVIITVVGKDNKGIIARVCTYLAEHEANILDISQTIVSGYFNMMMIVDLADTHTTFDQVQSDLGEAHRLSERRTAEDDILHFRAAQAL